MKAPMKRTFAALQLSRRLLMTAAFPLTWPDTISRHRARERWGFKTSLSGALKNVEGIDRSGQPLTA